MTTVIRRRGPFVALLGTLGLLLGACASGPSQVNAAAIVGGKTITVDRIQDLVERAVKAEPAARSLADQRKLGLFSREALKQLVQHELVEHYAAKEHITVDPGKVSEFARQMPAAFRQFPTDGSVPANTVVSQAIARVLDPEMIARDYLLMAEMGDREAAKLTVTFDFTVVSPPEQGKPAGSTRDRAMAKAQQLAADPKQATKLIEADVAAGQQAATDQVLTPAMASDIAGTVVFGAPANSVAVFKPSPEEDNWVIAIIRKRNPDGKPSDDPQAQPTAQLAQTLGPRLLESSVAEVGVQISPRYGVWDEVAMDIAPSAAETSGAVLPMKNPVAAP
ncbi:SurA N-terminal domain-containing protein [Actinokineospora enzanensis]|uniref:SurA N-terminal domain-containing protein n=1 Tax=Actinokineospora enzanensis TaxID=155975 RepID=UPI00036AF281|nr:SurA N-terminal domain-containing protein [Actinokineospora enzanensis]